MNSKHQAGLGLLVAAAVATAFVAPAPAHAQNLLQERGNIVSANWGSMEVELKDPRGRVKTWKVRRDAEVIFNDKKSDFPNPKLSDLRAPMYVHFSFEADSQEITRFEVAEVGFEPSRGGPGTSQEATVTNLDANIGHVEVSMNGATKTFEVSPKDQLKKFKIGDKVTILIEKQGPKEVVTKIERR